LELDHHGTWLGKRWVPDLQKFFSIQWNPSFKFPLVAGEADWMGTYSPFLGEISNAGYGKEHLE
jgi:hypothetical protein